MINFVIFILAGCHLETLRNAVNAARRSKQELVKVKCERIEQLNVVPTPSPSVVALLKTLLNQ